MKQKAKIMDGAGDEPAASQGSGTVHIDPVGVLASIPCVRKPEPATPIHPPGPLSGRRLASVSFHFSTICSASWVGYQLDDYGPSRPDSNRNGRGVEPLPHHRAAPCCARLSVLPLSRWWCRSTVVSSSSEVSALGLIPGQQNTLCVRPFVAICGRIHH